MGVLAVILVFLGCLASHNAFDSQTPVGYLPTFSSTSCGMYGRRSIDMELQRTGRVFLEGIERASNQETMMDYLWGTNCHSKALAALKKECRDLRPTEKSRLALMLLFCQVVHVQEHHEAAERLTCRQGDLLKVCVNRLSDREHSMYVEMLTHIDTMCLYIQNQDFEKFAEHMLNKIVKGSHAVARRMTDIENDLDIIRDTIRHQRNMHKDMYRNMSTGMEMMERYFERQKDVMQAMSSIYSHSMRLVQESTQRLEHMMESSSQKLQATFKTMREEASEAAMTQEAIKHDLKAIQESTTTIGSLFQSIHEYQRRTDKALSKILGSSYSLQDGVFFGFGILVVLAMGQVGISLETRAYVCIWLGISLILERSIGNIWDMIKYNVEFYGQYGIISGWLQRIILPQWVCTKQFVKTAIRKLVGASVLYVWLRQPRIPLQRRCAQNDCIADMDLIPIRPPKCPAGRRAFSEQVARPQQALGMLMDEADDAQSMPRHMASHGRNGPQPCLDIGPESLSRRRMVTTRSMLLRKGNPKSLAS